VKDASIHSANGTTTRKRGSLGTHLPADEIDIGLQEKTISNRQPVCSSSSQIGNEECEIEPVIHRLMKSCMSAYYMRLRHENLCWFRFLSRMAFVRSERHAIWKLATGLINEILTDVFR
jgi:hypothetical protein